MRVQFGTLFATIPISAGCFLGLAPNWAQLAQLPFHDHEINNPTCLRSPIISCVAYVITISLRSPVFPSVPARHSLSLVGLVTLYKARVPHFRLHHTLEVAPIGPALTLGSSILTNLTFSSPTLNNPRPSVPLIPLMNVAHAKLKYFAYLKSSGILLTVLFRFYYHSTFDS